MKVSVILPSYNRPALLTESLSSVLRQTYQNWECLVLNDHLPSKETVEAHLAPLKDPRIRIIHNEKNLHLAQNRNKGIRLAKGEIISFLDDDDIWLPEHLEKVVAKFAENPRLGLVFPGHINRWEGAISKEQVIPGALPPGNVFKAILNGKFSLQLGSVMNMRKACFETTGGFDSEMEYFDDWDILARFAKDFELGCVPEPTAIYRIHTGERVSMNKSERLEALEKLRKKWGDYPEFSRFARRFRLETYLSEIKTLSLKTHKISLIKLMVECIQRCGITDFYHLKAMIKMSLIILFGNRILKRFS